MKPKLQYPSQLVDVSTDKPITGDGGSGPVNPGSSGSSGPGETKAPGGGGGGSAGGAAGGGETTADPTVVEGSTVRNVLHVVSIVYVAN